MKILITGGAGYIGSHTALQLLKDGHEVTILDNLEKGRQDILNRLKQHGGEFEFWGIDLRDLSSLRTNLENSQFDAAIHFAAYIEVGLSVQKPEMFYANNILGSYNLFQELAEGNITDKVIFSSTAAVYGTPESVPIPETAAKKPDSPYGTSKLVTEQILENFCKYQGLNAVALRYFNPSGSADGLIGEQHTPETHLIPRMLNAFVSSETEFGVYGTDYNTPDGSAIRDYIHIQDLVDAHIKCIEFLGNNNGFETFNVGTGQGYSVLEVIKAGEKVMGKPLNYKVHPKREGDSERLVADPAKIKQVMGWEAKYGLEDIVSSAWKWQQQIAAAS